MSSVTPETLHPALWRGSQLGRHSQRCLDTGHPVLSAVLPDGGWPVGALTEVLGARPGIGEVRLLHPALAGFAPSRRIALLRPPCVPHAAGWPLPPERLLWVRPEHDRDALWAAEQILKNGSCSALLYWEPHIRTTSLRRLHLAAQAHDTLLFLFRHSSAAQHASPAPLRVHVQAAGDFLQVDIVKRRGPQLDHPVFLPLAPRLADKGQRLLPPSSDALVDQRPSDTAQPRRPVPLAAG